MVQYYEIMVFSLSLTLDQTMNYQALAWAELGPPTMRACVCLVRGGGGGVLGFGVGFGGLNYSLCNFVKVAPFFLLELTV